MQLPFEPMMKMTIPQLRFLLSLGLKDEHQLSPDQMAPFDDKGGDDWMTSPHARAESASAEECEISATGVGPKTLARDIN